MRIDDNTHLFSIAGCVTTDDTVNIFDHLFQATLEKASGKEGVGQRTTGEENTLG